MTSTHIDLTPYLEQIGMTVRKVSGAEAICLCPNHDDTTGKFSFNQVRLVGHCWVCEFRVPSLNALVKYMTGGDADPDLVAEARSYSLAQALNGSPKKKPAENYKVLEWKFSQLVAVPARLLEFRRLRAEHASFFDVRFDPALHCWVLPIHSPAGKLWGWQRRQKGGFDNYPAGVVKSDSLFGLHRFNARRLVLVESPLDACRLHQVGIDAVSSYGAEVSARQTELLARNCSEVVLAMDNDGPGRKATSWLIHQLRQRVGVVPWQYGTDQVKDPGDYRTDEEIRTAWRRTLRYGL